jgi:phosphoribosyl-ATP pyrophosphohydrolase/phosphoribosyl-AMP cyclohydrolase
MSRNDTKLRKERSGRTAERLRFDDGGLIPAVVQDWRDGTVLMVGFMNAEALAATRRTGFVHFWSRSRGRLWKKGESSGHVLAVKDRFVDCDGDTLLIKAEPAGPTCHTGARSCFFRPLDSRDRNGSRVGTESFGGVLNRVAETIEDRRRHPKPGSYVSALFEGGTDRILKKVVEEAGEAVLAAKNGKKAEIVYEVADLLFHTLVLLGSARVSIQDVYAELASRVGQPAKRIPATKDPQKRRGRRTRDEGKPRR